MDTVAKAKNDQNQLYDVNGNLEHLARWQVNLLIIIGWVSYIISLILTVIYYAIHPSAPMKTPDTKLVVHIFGRRWDLRNCTCRRHGEFYIFTDFFRNILGLKNSNYENNAMEMKIINP